MIYKEAYRLNLVLEDPRNHWTGDKRNVIWNNICYPNDISEFVFDRDEENSDQLESEASNDSEDEIDDDCWLKHWPVLITNFWLNYVYWLVANLGFYASDNFFYLDHLTV